MGDSLPLTGGFPCLLTDFYVLLMVFVCYTVRQGGSMGAAVLVNMPAL